MLLAAELPARQVLLLSQRFDKKGAPPGPGSSFPQGYSHGEK
jgi:hypothetical protein